MLGAHRISVHEYKAVLGFPNYAIGDCGELVALGPGYQLIPITPRLNAGGYHIVSLKNPDGESKAFLVHRLVLETFVGPCPEGMETRHLNGIRTDNRLVNLAWGTYKENQRDRITHGTYFTRGPLPGELNGRAKLTENNVREIILSKECNKDLAQRFGVTSSTITTIQKRITWKHVKIST